MNNIAKLVYIHTYFYIRNKVSIVIRKRFNSQVAFINRGQTQMMTKYISIKTDNGNSEKLNIVNSQSQQVFAVNNNHRKLHCQYKNC